MKFACTCGNTIRDQTDYLRYAGHLIADQDVFEAAEMSDRGLGDWWPSLTRRMYQCESCGRLWIDDQSGKLKSFVPEQSAEHFLSSIHGRKWKRILRGSWTDERTLKGVPRGFLSWEHLSDEDQATFDDWESLETVYRKQFESLKKQGILRDALLKKNGAIIHQWELTLDQNQPGEQDGGGQPATSPESK